MIQGRFAMCQVSQPIVNILYLFSLLNAAPGHQYWKNQNNMGIVQNFYKVGLYRWHADPNIDLSLLHILNTYLSHLPLTIHIEYI